MSFRLSALLWGTVVWAWRAMALYTDNGQVVMDTRLPMAPLP
jgi:hypothetical protein